MESNFKKQPVPFTQVPNELLYNNNISFKAKGIWAYMSAKPDGWYFSADRIADETKEERKSILAGLKELSSNGYITAKKLKTGRVEYTLHWEVCKDIPDTEAKPTTPTTNGRPRRSDFANQEEYEKAFYNWTEHSIIKSDSTSTV